MPTVPDPGRRARFERVALPVAPALFRTARRLSRQADDALDLVQETLLRAYRTFDNFQEGTNERAWLFTILYSIVSNQWQRDRRSPGVFSIDDTETGFERALASGDADPEELLLARLDASAEVDRALASLPDAHRAAVLLVDLEGLTYEEAAAALACPVGTVRSRLARARRQLFVMLHDYARRSGALKGVRG